MNLDLQLAQRGDDEDAAFQLLISWCQVFAANQEVYTATPRASEHMQHLLRWIEDNLALINIPATTHFRQQRARPLPEQ